MARQLLHPSSTELIEGIWKGTDVALEEVTIFEGSPLVGVTLRDSPIRQELDVMAIGVLKADANVEFNPAPDLAFEAGDTLVALGNAESLRRLERMAEPGGAR
jgi:K+/H+ antiporter YhaU regulatory subunit KhtT